MEQWDSPRWDRAFATQRHDVTFLLPQGLSAWRADFPGGKWDFLLHGQPWEDSQRFQAPLLPLQDCVASQQHFPKWLENLQCPVCHHSQEKLPPLGHPEVTALWECWLPLKSHTLRACQFFFLLFLTFVKMSYSREEEEKCPEPVTQSYATKCNLLQWPCN